MHGLTHCSCLPGRQSRCRWAPACAAQWRSPGPRCTAAAAPWWAFRVGGHMWGQAEVLHQRYRVAGWLGTDTDQESNVMLALINSGSLTLANPVRASCSVPLGRNSSPAEDDIVGEGRQVARVHLARAAQHKLFHPPCQLPAGCARSTAGACCNGIAVGRLQGAAGGQRTLDATRRLP